MQYKQSGFSMIELMIVIAISAILVAMAAPSFRTSIRNASMDTLQSNLSMALKLARSEAIAGTPRNRGYNVDNVNVCATSNNTSCSSTWGNGWMVYVPTTAAGSTPGVVLRVFKGDSTFTISPDTATPNNIIFNSLGFPTSDGSAVIRPSFTLTDSQSMATTKTLTMENTGSITVQ
ncbi:MAG TPA: GspH/FimT family pseudopilin [Pseudomonadales bacterium]|nr:GspH/FimT family pseudopilin [Pseudomonadales bacterium]